MTAYDDHGCLDSQIRPAYLPHQFREVFDFLSQFTEWRPYEHRVLASVDGKLVPVPINLDTVNRLYGLKLAPQNKWKISLRRGPSNAPRSAPPKTSSSAGGPRPVREVVPELHPQAVGTRSLGARRAVTARIPVRTNRDDRYFTDAYQAMPLHGYTRLFENMLDHPNITDCAWTRIIEMFATFIPHRDCLHGPGRRVFRLSLRQAALPLAGIQASRP